MSHVTTIRRYIEHNGYGFVTMEDGERSAVPLKQAPVLVALDALVEALVTLADNAEAYLQLEEDGQRNYPDSLRLCIEEARAAVTDA